MKSLLTGMALILFLANTAIGQETGDCGGSVTGMNASPVSCSGIRVRFTRPAEPKKYWSDPRVPEYEAYYTITYKPVFPQGYNTGLLRSNDTSMKEHSFQFTANEQVSYWEYIDLLPATTYEFCVYTRCGPVKTDPLCGTATTTNEAPCDLVVTHTSKEGASFDFKYHPKTIIRPNRIILEYRKDGDKWTEKECSSSNSSFLYNLETNTTYYARLKFEYYNKVVSPYTNEVSFTTGEK